MHRIFYAACASLACALSLTLESMDPQTMVHAAALNTVIEGAKKELKQSTDRSWKNRRRDPGTRYPELSSSHSAGKKSREIREHIDEEQSNFKSYAH